MKTSVVGVRLNDYQLEKLDDIAEDLHCQRVEVIRILIDKLIEGKIQVKNTTVVDGIDLADLKRIADSKGLSLQRMIDLIVEQLNEPNDRPKGE